MAARYTQRVPTPSDREHDAGQNDADRAPQLGLFAEAAERKPAANLQELRRRVQPPRRPPAATATRRREEAELPAWSRPTAPALGEQEAVREARPLPFPGGQETLEPNMEPVPGSDSGDELAPAGRRIWTVADLVSTVRTRVEQTWADLWVHGEISNLRAAPSGHLYFTLKDGESQLPAVLFRRQAQMLRFKPEDGLEVLLRGKVSVYEQRGQMQLIAEHLEPVGAGSLQIAFEQLKARLSADGLFAPERKQALPPYPRCIGIVTSPAGAVIRDFMTVAARRHAALQILLYPATVQGGSAAFEVAAGIAYFNQARNVDVIVIARGGGSLEDLAPFNTELLARAIAASTLPVVSAIGHETDFTIADFVADLRAPTPSAAAELITQAQHKVEEQVSALAARLQRACRYQLIVARQRLGALAVNAAAARMAESLNRRQQRVDELRFRMEAAMRKQLHTAAARIAAHSVEATHARLLSGVGGRRRVVDALRHRLEACQAQRMRAHGERLQRATAALLRQDAAHQLQLLRHQWTQLDNRLARLGEEQTRRFANRHDRAARQLASLSPIAVLSRGYALVFDAKGGLVKRATDVQAGDLLRVQLAEGSVTSRALSQNEEA